ncbi:hypothetical protein [Bacillus pseudomycoides]|nr:hypothetical protein [Bacillus pseudomycoides]EEM02762.1 hypothetical protein bmyco0002_48240 [Bacillus pseudomycoides]EEM08299.1 hypothetical protein bmyco0003_50110 [Bacillus pseudomycoides]
MSKQQSKAGCCYFIGRVSPEDNRAPGKKDIASDNRIQSHYPLQNE